jgi:hypothetical protein
MWLFDRIRPVTTALGPRIALTLETAKEVRAASDCRDATRWVSVSASLAIVSVRFW